MLPTVSRSLIALGGALVVAATLALGLFSDLQLARSRFVVDSAALQSTIARRLDSSKASLQALTGLHHATTRLSSQELSAFAQELADSYPYLRAIYHLALVLPEERSGFEADMRERGFPTFRIVHRKLDGHLTAAPPAARHMPLSLVEPLEPAHARLLGLDLLSVPSARQAIERAVSSAEVTAAPAVEAGDNAFLLIKAVYKGFFIPDDPVERRAQVQGVYALVVDSPRFLADIKADGEDFEIRLWGNHGDRRELLLRHPGPRVHTLSRLLPANESRLPIALGVSQFELALAQPLHAANLHPVRWGILGAVLLALYVAAAYGLQAKRGAAQREQEAQEQLHHEKERALVTLQSIGEAVITTDPNGVVDFMNPVAESLTGWSAEQANGRHLEEIFSLLSETDGQPLPDPIARALRDHDHSEAAAVMVRSDGATVAVVENAAAIQDRSGDFTGAVLIVRDVSKERRLIRQMAYQAAHDPLTQLINRREFEREVALLVEDAQSTGNCHALMYIDLDQFKAINDSCGHLAGDQLLKQVATHLKSNIRKLDLLARLGGDEFGVLLRDCGMAQALEVAEALRREIKDPRLRWEDKDFRISLSVGLVSITRGSGGLDDVLRTADAACYVAKDHGRNRVHVYQPDDEALAERTSDMQWLQKLREALEKDRLVLYCQDIRPLIERAGFPMMCELLVRMLDSDGRLVPPMTFIPVAERYNLMFDLDLWVIGRAFAQIADHDRDCPDDERIFNINLSGQSLDHSDLENAVAEQQQKWGLDGRRVCFEITETSVIANMERALGVMGRLRRRGFRFAMDDFGTGLSSFAYLKKLPVNYLKIDGEFVRDILNDPVDRAMVQTIHQIGHVLGMATIAEAIEDQATVKLLADMGVDYGQGFYLSRPAPAIPEKPTAVSLVGA